MQTISRNESSAEAVPTSGGLSEYAGFVNAPPPDFPRPYGPLPCLERHRLDDVGHPCEAARSRRLVPARIRQGSPERRGQSDVLIGRGAPMYPPAATYPELVEKCDACDWSSACDKRRHDDDHLSLVANITRHQRAALGDLGITTVAGLAKLPIPLAKPRRAPAPRRSSARASRLACKSPRATPDGTSGGLRRRVSGAGRRSVTGVEAVHIRPDKSPNAPSRVGSTPKLMKPLGRDCPRRAPAVSPGAPAAAPSAE